MSREKAGVGVSLFFTESDPLRASLAAVLSSRESEQKRAAREALNHFNAGKCVLWNWRSARLKLDRVEATVVLKDLAELPCNRFEALKGKRKGQYSIRMNDQRRICFEWLEGALGPSKVEIVDYH